MPKGSSERGRRLLPTFLPIIRRRRPSNRVSSGYRVCNGSGPDRLGRYQRGHMYRRVSVVTALVLGSLLVASDSHGTPLSVAYVDTVTGMEWAQVSETTGSAYWDVAA